MPYRLEEAVGGFQKTSRKSPRRSEYSDGICGKKEPRENRAKPPKNIDRR